MEHSRPLTPCLIGRGTLSNPRDVLRALETVEHLTYRFIVHGETIEEGAAALVKLMADDESSTILVNGCLFLNIASFRYLDFEPVSSDIWRFVLHGDGSTLELVTVPEADEAAESGRPSLLNNEAAPDFETLLAFDDDDEED